MTVTLTLVLMTVVAIVTVAVLTVTALTVTIMTPTVVTVYQGSADHSHLLGDMFCHLKNQWVVL